MWPKTDFVLISICRPNPLIPVIITGKLQFEVLLGVPMKEEFSICISKFLCSIHFVHLRLGFSQKFSIQMWIDMGTLELTIFKLLIGCPVSPWQRQSRQRGKILELPQRFFSRLWCFLDRIHASALQSFACLPPHGKNVSIETKFICNEHRSYELKFKYLVSLY